LLGKPTFLSEIQQLYPKGRSWFSFGKQLSPKGRS